MKILSLILVMTITLNSYSQWQRINGPYVTVNNITDSITHFSCLASNADSIYACTGGEIYTYPDGVSFQKYSNTDNCWSTLYSNLDTYVWALVSNQNMLYIGALNTLSLSTNNGTYWSSIANFGDVRSLDVSSDTIIAGTSNNLLLSTNNGVSWSSINTGIRFYDNELGTYIVPGITSIARKGNYIFAGTQPHDGTWYYNDSSEIFFSSDLGQHWSRVNNGLPFAPLLNNRINSLKLKGDTVYAGTNLGLYRSTDNGNNWSNINTGLSCSPTRTLLVYENLIFAGTDCGVFFTNDNGNNWIPFNSGLTTRINSISINQGYIFAGTNNNGGWKRSLTETGIKERYSNKPEIYLYPNPAINNLTVKCQSKSEIEIFNIQGLHIETIVAKYNETNINIASLPEGIYIVKVITVNGIAVKKFVKE